MGPGRHQKFRASSYGGRLLVGLALAVASASCSETLDFGTTMPRGPLPVDERNPIILVNDGPYDNWQGEYAILLANGGGPQLAGIVVTAQQLYPDMNANFAGWQAMVSAARKSGLGGIPDPIKGSSTPLARPANDDIAAAVPNGSEGARFILRESSRRALPYRPVVVATGGSLTDIADAYLLDPTVAERIVVVSALGTQSTAGGAMGGPNGDLDPWASAIVATRFRYVQVSTWYEQTLDMPEARWSDLPDSPFADWMVAKRTKILKQIGAADQVTVEATGIPGFVVGLERVSAGPLAPGGNNGPDLALDSNGHVWLVTQIASVTATSRFGELLRNPTTYHR
jgi:hypothetical protein